MRRYQQTFMPPTNSAVFYGESSFLVNFILGVQKWARARWVCLHSWVLDSWTLQLYARSKNWHHNHEGLPLHRPILRNCSWDNDDQGHSAILASGGFFAVIAPSARSNAKQRLHYFFCVARKCLRPIHPAAERRPLQPSPRATFVYTQGALMRAHLFCFLTPPSAQDSITRNIAKFEQGQHLRCTAGIPIIQQKKFISVRIRWIVQGGGGEW